MTKAQKQVPGLPLGKDEPTLRLWNGSTQFFCCLNPFLGNNYNILESFLVSCSVGSTSRQFRHLGNECLIFLAPVNNDFVSIHRLQMPGDISG